MSILARKPKAPPNDVADRCRKVARVLIGWSVRGDGVEPVDRLLENAAAEIERLSEAHNQDKEPLE